MASYTIKYGQTIWDLALQLYGDSSKAVQILKDNKTIIPDLNYRYLAGLTITYTETANSITNFFKSQNISIATRYPEINMGGRLFGNQFSGAFAQAGVGS